MTDFHFTCSDSLAPWEPITARFEILGHGEHAVVLQVDEQGLPYTPAPLLDSQGREIDITCSPATITIYSKADDGT